MDNETLENINRNLEVIISLLLRTLPDPDAEHLRGRILMLNELEMRPKDISVRRKGLLAQRDECLCCKTRRVAKTASRGVCDLVPNSPEKFRLMRFG